MNWIEEYNRWEARKVALVYLDSRPGDFINDTAARARANNCQFFVFNGCVVPAEYPELPAGVEYTDCPRVEEWYLRGRMRFIQEAADKRRRDADEKERRYRAAVARLSPEDRKDLGL